MNNELLKNYKELPENIKNNLDDLLVYRACYERDENISDEMVLFINSIAHNCWLDDDYSKASKDYYADYLLNAIYNHGITQEQLQDLNCSDVVRAFNDELDIIELFKFDKENYEYWFTTKDNNKYYADDDGFYVVNEDGMEIKSSHPMENVYDEIFDLLKYEKIKEMPLSAHYNIRCIIKNDIIGDEELEVQYKEGIENYKKFCKEKNITSNDILNIVKSNENINITKEDELYCDECKLLRLENVLQKTGNKDARNYEYIASFNNKTDYYYNKEDKMYLVIDKNDVTKYFEDDTYFIVKELNASEKLKIVYLKPKEADKIAIELCETNFEKKMGRDQRLTSSIYRFVDYNKTKELKPFKNENENRGILLEISACINDMQKKDIENRRKMATKINEDNKQKDIGQEL